MYAAMIESVDQSVGRILAKLEALKLTGNTIVIFASDNGGVGGYQAAGVNAHSTTNNFPLRGGKGMLYEGVCASRSSFAGPGIFPRAEPATSPAHHIDMYRTFVELAGKKTLPETAARRRQPGQTMEKSGRQTRPGRDLLPLSGLSRRG